MLRKIKVGYSLIPAVRCELVESVIENLKLPQKEVAKNIASTEVAFFMNSKRSKEAIFTEAVLS